MPFRRMKVRRWLAEIKRLEVEDEAEDKRDGPRKGAENS